MCLFLLFFTCLPIYSQTKKEERLKPEKYQHVLQGMPQDQLEVKTVKNGMIVAEPVAVEQLRLKQDQNLAFIDVREDIRPVASRALLAGDHEIRHLEGLALPGYYIARVVGEAAPVLLKVLINEKQHLVFNNESNKFEGAIGFVLLDDSGDALTSRELNEPVLVEVSTGTESHSAELRHTNLPTTIFPVTAANPVDEFGVSIRTPFKPEGYRDFLSVKPVVRILTDKTTMQGYGIQRTPVRLSLHGATGFGELIVTVSSSKGTISPYDVILKEGQTSTATLISEGTGKSRISVVETDRYTGTETWVEFVFPLVFLIFALVGGLIGAIVKIYYAEKKERKFLYLLIGPLLGCVIAIAYWAANVNILGLKVGFEYFNEFAVLAMSFFGSLFGISLINKFFKQ